MREWLKQNSSAVWSWAALIVGSMVIFLASRGTSFQQFGVGLLVASICLLALITIFEVIWQTAARWLGRWSETNASQNTPGSRHGGG